jgi:hypothetical protein
MSTALHPEQVSRAAMRPAAHRSTMEDIVASGQSVFSPPSVEPGPFAFRVITARDADHDRAEDIIIDFAIEMARAGAILILLVVFCGLLIAYH